MTCRRCTSNSMYMIAYMEVYKFKKSLFLQNLPWPEIREEMVDDGPERIIIFSPRVCNDIDLDIGK